MASVLKKTTKLTGLAVAQSPHHTLTALYGKILRTLQSVPESSAYRKYTEEVVRSRNEIVKNTPSVAEFEEKIGCGQVEELIVQAENELNLAKKFSSWQAWEPLSAPAPNDQWKWPPVK